MFGDKLRRRFAGVLCSVTLVSLAVYGSSAVLTGPAASAASGPAPYANRTINLAYGADMQVPDPDIFYEIEGNSVVTSVYEGLVKYADNSTNIIPALAQSWTISPNGLTYTFHLRAGVKFHDGTPFDSAAAKFSLERRKGVNSAPAYMVANVVSMDTPDPLTFVVNLNEPVAAFMNYLASPYGPKMISPTLVKAHEVGGSPGDWAQAYLKTHDAGTGPYEISQFVPGSHYVLSADPSYWGTKPYYTTINIHIVPDISTQQVELSDGQLTMSLHGLPINAVESFEKNTKFQVIEEPDELKAMLYVNPNIGVFKSQAVRTALRSAIDKKAIVASVYGDKIASVSTQAYPRGEFPAGQAMDDPTYDPSLLKKALANVSGSKTVQLVYSTDDPNNQRVAEFIQIELEEEGLSITTRGVPISQVFNYASTPAGQLPNLLVWTVNPDDAAPDSWIRIFNNTGGSLNEMHGSVPAADKLMDAGLHSLSPAVSQKDYAQAGTLVADSGEWISIADVDDTIVAPVGMTGFYSQPPTVDTVVLGLLHPTGS
jgi:peptide/nickel transport system substrate-binding protein